jgi:hypothetical protein
LVPENHNLGLRPHQARAAFEAIRTSPTRETLRRLIADLEPEAQLELITLAWIGRGNSDDHDVITGFELAERTTAATDAAYFLSGTAALARYLRSALEKIGAEYP